jgi:peroxiredoxin Q/BCP
LLHNGTVVLAPRYAITREHGAVLRGKLIQDRRSVSMKNYLAVALAGCLCAPAAFAELKVGDVAPLFTAPATVGGKEFTFSLTDALKKGPVVVYFYPAAFTKGCTIEAHQFAEATTKYEALGATVIGVSNDKIDKLKDFSTQECSSKFPLAADTDQKIMKSYDAVLAAKPEYASRTSYVVAPDRKIIYAYTDMKPDEHVGNTLGAVQQWKDEHKN